MPVLLADDDAARPRSSPCTRWPRGRWSGSAGTSPGSLSYFSGRSGASSRRRPGRGPWPAPPAASVLGVVGAAEDDERVRAERLEVVRVEHADVRARPWPPARRPAARRPRGVPEELRTTVQAVSPSGHSARPGLAVVRRSRAWPTRGVGRGRAVGVGVAPPSAPGAGVAVGVAGGAGVGVPATSWTPSASLRELDDREHDGDQREREQHADDRDARRASRAARRSGCRRRRRTPGTTPARRSGGRRSGGSAARPGSAAEASRRCSRALLRGDGVAELGRRLVARRGLRRARARAVLARVLRQRALVLVGGLLGDGSGAGGGCAAGAAAAARSRSAAWRSAIARSVASSACWRARSVSGVPQCEHQPASEPCSSPQVGHVPPMPGSRTTVCGRAGRGRARPRGRAAPRRSSARRCALRSMMSRWPPCGAPPARWTS